MTVATLHPDLRSGWRAALLAIPGIPTEWAWEARSFTPTLGTPWIRESFRPINSTVRALGRGGTIAHRCTGNLSVFYPANQGTKDIEAAVGLILAALAPGTSITYGTASATILQAERAALITEPDWVSCPVIVTLMAHTVN